MALNEYDLTKADLAQNRAIDRMNQRLDSVERELAKLGIPALAAEVATHKTAIDNLMKVFSDAQKVAAEVHSFIQAIHDRVAHIEERLEPFTKALDYLQSIKGQEILNAFVPTKAI